MNVQSITNLMMNAEYLEAEWEGSQVMSVGDICGTQHLESDWPGG
jgi:hypothetical protein